MIKNKFIAAALFGMVAFAGVAFAETNGSATTTTGGSATSTPVLLTSIFSVEQGVIKSGVTASSSQITVEVKNNCKALPGTTCAAWYSKDVTVDVASILVTNKADQVLMNLAVLQNGMPVILYYKSGVVYAMKAMAMPAGIPIPPKEPKEDPTEPKMCTMEAKQCPDGSYVGRGGPKCEFAKCPGEISEKPKAEKPKIVRHLQIGMKAEDVAKLQKFLQELGYFPEDQEISGYFGNLTLKAVKEFQRSKDLPPTGFVGPLTIQKISD